MVADFVAEMGNQSLPAPREESFQAGVLRQLSTTAERLALERNDAEVAPVHLLWSLSQCGDRAAREQLEQMGLSPGVIRAELARQIPPGDRNSVFVGKPGLNDKSVSALDEATREADRLGQKPANWFHVLLGLLIAGELQQFLFGLRVSADSAKAQARAKLEKKEEHDSPMT